MIRLLVGTAAMIVALVLIMTAMRLIGGWAAQPAAAAILDPGSCPQPCWHGIQPGKTTFRQAQAIFRASPDRITLPNDYLTSTSMRFTLDTRWYGQVYRLGDTASNLDNSLQFIILQPPANTMRLGDALLLFGEPLASVLCPSWPVYPPQSGSRIYKGNVFFQGNIEATVVSGESRFDPHMPVTSITYLYPADEPPYRFDTPPWRGFARVNDQEVCLR
jgi:hypothetical protein